MNRMFQIFLYNVFSVEQVKGSSETRQRITSAARDIRSSDEYPPELRCHNCSYVNEKLNDHSNKLISNGPYPALERKRIWICLKMHSVSRLALYLTAQDFIVFVDVSKNFIHIVLSDFFTLFLKWVFPRRYHKFNGAGCPKIMAGYPLTCFFLGKLGHKRVRLLLRLAYQFLDPAQSLSTKELPWGQAPDAFEIELGANHRLRINGRIPLVPARKTWRVSSRYSGMDVFFHYVLDAFCAFRSTQFL